MRAIVEGIARRPELNAATGPDTLEATSMEGSHAFVVKLRKPYLLVMLIIRALLQAEGAAKNTEILLIAEHQ